MAIPEALQSRQKCAEFRSRLNGDQDPNVPSILGRPVFRVVQQQMPPESNPPGHGNEWVQWIAPEMNCLVAKEVFQATRARDGEVVQARNEEEMVSFLDGEPGDEMLFQIPEGYQEMSPSDYLRDLYAGNGAECHLCDSEMMRQRDEAYHGIIATR